MSARGYSDVHFAAVLLVCGPHVDLSGADLGWRRSQYRDRVYSHFFKLFPEMAPCGPNIEMPKHEWTEFWHEYIQWVETPSL